MTELYKNFLQEKSLEVVKYFSENHWTPSCVITMRKFQEICGGSKEASVILSHLSECQKAKYLVINKNDRVEVNYIIFKLWCTQYIDDEKDKPWHNS